MNERFIELMNEANKDAGFTFSMDQAKPIHDLMEKFAELIIQEYSYDVMNLTNMPDHVAFAARKWGVEL
jgi:hypothetical protein